MSLSRKKFQIAVLGSSDPAPPFVSLAIEIGRAIAEVGGILVCGGLGGVMEAAARGAKEKGGLTVGILPSYDKKTANAFIDVIVPTGLGHARNILVAASGDAIVALPGSHGTRSEISIALKLGKPVIGVRGWGEISGVKKIHSIDELKREFVHLF
jgi:uncharacterized protein (TIGR00725 family)